MFRLSEVLLAFGISTSDIRDIVFSEAVIDSRHAGSGILFAAIPGENTDGHQYVPSAFEKGSPAALIEEDISADAAVIDLRTGDLTAYVPDKPLCLRVENTVKALQQIAAYHRSILPLQVIGLTGSVGKTTTKELVSQVLSRKYNTLKTAGNMNNEIGLPLTLLRADEKTELAVLEMGFYVPGEIKLLCDISHPKTGVITNVGMVHASRAGSMEVIAKGKQELIEALPADGVAILNYDDPYVRPMAQASAARVFYYGLDPSADLWADEIESRGLQGIRFTLHYQGEAHVINAPLIGQHSVLTALRAAAVAITAGLNWDEIREGMEGEQTQLRLSVVHGRNGELIIDDTYNASPESTLAALNLLAELDGKKIAVLGDMRELGQYEQKGHEMVGVRAAAVCSSLITVGTSAAIIADAARSAGMDADAVRYFPTVPEAVDYVKQTGFKAGDVILVKGSRSLMMERITHAMEEAE